MTPRGRPPRRGGCAPAGDHRVALAPTGWSHRTPECAPACSSRRPPARASCRAARMPREVARCSRWGKRSCPRVRTVGSVATRQARPRAVWAGMCLHFLPRECCLRGAAGPILPSPCGRWRAKPRASADARGAGAREPASSRSSPGCSTRFATRSGFAPVFRWISRGSTRWPGGEVSIRSRRPRHPDRPEAAGALGCQDHDDLHARPESGTDGRAVAAGWVGGEARVPKLPIARYPVEARSLTRMGRARSKGEKLPE